MPVTLRTRAATFGAMAELEAPPTSPLGENWMAPVASGPRFTRTPSNVSPLERRGRTFRANASRLFAASATMEGSGLESMPRVTTAPVGTFCPENMYVCWLKPIGIVIGAVYISEHRGAGDSTTDVKGLTAVIVGGGGGGGGGGRGAEGPGGPPSRAPHPLG